MMRGSKVPVTVPPVVGLLMLVAVESVPPRPLAGRYRLVWLKML